MNNKPIMEVDKYGQERWYLNGKLHREDGPALKTRNGHKEWWINGLLHREDGPAIEWIIGDNEWFINGICINTIKNIFEECIEHWK